MRKRKNPSKTAGAREHLYQAVVSLDRAAKVPGWPKHMLSKLRLAQHHAAKAGLIVDDILHGE